MLKVLLLFIVVGSVYAVELVVKKADVEVNINSQKLTLSKGKKINLEEGSTICYLAGKGKIVISELKKQLKKPGRCLSVPISESMAEVYMKSLKKAIVTNFLDSTERVKHGVGTKGINNGAQIGFTETELVIISEEFGPLPVTAVIKDESGEELYSFENEESDVTAFRISKSLLKPGMVVEVYNGFEEFLLDEKIVIQ